MSKNRKYTEKDCIKALNKAEQMIGESPSQKDYEDLGLSPCYQTIHNIIGWNEAKERAGLDKKSSGIDVQLEKPEILNISEDEWKNSTTNKRQYLTKKCKLARIKLSEGCNICGYNNHPDALDFHHTNRESKEFSVSVGYLQGSYSWNEIKREIKKCEVLCSNCHREIDSYDFNLENL